MEADRGTMGIDSIRRKMLAYVGLIRQGLHKTAYGLPYFRVLIVTTTIYRRDRFRVALESIGYCQNMFLFTPWQEIHQFIGINTGIFEQVSAEYPSGLLDLQRHLVVF